jgi:transcriptional regulator with XRE-family HTH domain
MGFMAKKRDKLSNQIRRAVKVSGLSRYRICKEVGILQSVMSRFMSGQGMLSMERLDDLADLLDLNITVGKATKVKKGPIRGQHQ